MRCSICNWSEIEAGTFRKGYWPGFHNPYEDFVTLHLDEKTGTYICSVCDKSVRDTLSEFQNEEDLG